MEIVHKQVLNIKNFFSGKELLKIAKEVKFLKRLRRITPFCFLKSILVASNRDHDSSLEFLVSLLYDNNITVTRQSLHAKINDQAVEFVKRLFDNLCQSFIGWQLIKGPIKKITDIIVVDSSQIKLPRILEAVSREGQNGPRRKVQVLYSLLSNCIRCEITKANKNDQSYKDYLEHVSQGNLVLLDLGYFSIKSFETIESKRGYFVSRLLRNVLVSRIAHGPMAIDKLLRETKGDTIDIQVLIGQEHKLNCRLVGNKLTDELLKKRQKKLERDRKRNHRQVRQQLEEIDYWSLYITNLDNTVSSNEIHNLYKLRWQVELLFKVMKSKLSIDKIRDCNKNKALLMIYGKSILLALAMIFLSTYQKPEISLYKAIDYYKQKFELIFDDLVAGRWNRIKDFLAKTQRFAKKASRKNRPSTKQLCGFFDLFSSA